MSHAFNIVNLRQEYFKTSERKSNELEMKFK